MYYKTINWPISICILLLLSVSILVIYSFSATLAVQQVLFAITGIILYLFLSQFDYRSLSNFIMWFYFIVLLLLVLVLILGFESRGSIRWIPLGLFNIQPSELVKPVLILFLARFWSTHRGTWRNIFISLGWLLPVVFLVFKQPDLGTTLTIIVVWTGLLLLSSVSIKKLLILILIFLFLTPIGWFSLHDYQKQRITSFLSPWQDPLGQGYNLIQSTIAVGSGQIQGRGLGRGTQSRLQFLPEHKTDFIFASIAEEFGFLGSISIISIYFFLICYCFRVASRASEQLGFYIGCGVAINLLFQTVVNVGMNIGILPITGITLPLLSYGGSSLVATLISLGLVTSISRYSQKIDIVKVGV